MNRPAFSYAFILLLLVACNDGEVKSAEPVKPGEPTKNTPVKKPLPVTKSAKPPIINIVDTITVKRTVVYFKDSAANFQRISGKLALIYGAKFAECFRKGSLKPAGQPMAWYTTRKAPYFFEAGIPVNRKPGKLIPGAYVREMRVDSAVIAHFYGPYDQIKLGYDALEEWMTDHKKRPGGLPYEIYVTDPVDKKGKPVDPYKIQTDIVFPKK